MSRCRAAATRALASFPSLGPWHRGAGPGAPHAVWGADVRVVIPLKDVPHEDELIAVAAAPAGVKIVTLRRPANRFPTVFSRDPAAHERPSVPHSSRRYHRRERALPESASRFLARRRTRTPPRARRKNGDATPPNRGAPASTPSLSSFRDIRPPTPTRRRSAAFPRGERPCHVAGRARQRTTRSEMRPHAP
jgi:hypothetical protein